MVDNKNRRDNRLTQLKARLERFNASHPDSSRRRLNSDDRPRSRSDSTGIKIITDFVAAIVVGVVIGLAIDKWFDTSPIAILIFVILGFITGFYNLVRAGRHQHKDNRSVNQGDNHVYAQDSDHIDSQTGRDADTRSRDDTANT